MVIAERFRFHRRNQGVGESIVEFVVELRKLAKTCNFGAYLDQALRNQFVCGLRNEAVQRRLLTKPDTLTFARAVEVVEGMEAAETNTQQWKGAEAMIQVDSRKQCGAAVLSLWTQQPSACRMPFQGCYLPFLR